MLTLSSAPFVGSGLSTISATVAKRSLSETTWVDVEAA